MCMRAGASFIACHNTGLEYSPDSPLTLLHRTTCREQLGCISLRHQCCCGEAEKGSSHSPNSRKAPPRACIAIASFCVQGESFPSLSLSSLQSNSNQNMTAPEGQQVVVGKHVLTATPAAGWR
jgi:hypothetical protein